MEKDIETRLDEQDQKLDQIYISVEKTRKYFLIITWVTILAVVLPIVALLFAIPSFLSSYSSLLGL